MKRASFILEMYEYTFNDHTITFYGRGYMPTVYSKNKANTFFYKVFNKLF